MLKFLFVLLAVAGIISCNNMDEKTSATTDSIQTTGDATINTTAKVNLTGCWLRVIQKDSLSASLVQQGNFVTGKLVFDNFEKDGSSGTVSGRIENNIARLVYRFQSEGMNSISEVYFKITENGLIHGIGEVAVKGDSAYYADPARISFPANETLQKISCESLPERMRK